MKYRCLWDWENEIHKLIVLYYQVYDIVSSNADLNWSCEIHWFYFKISFKFLPHIIVSFHLRIYSIACKYVHSFNEIINFDCDTIKVPQRRWFRTHVLIGYFQRNTFGMSVWIQFARLLVHFPIALSKSLLETSCWEKLNSKQNIKWLFFPSLSQITNFREESYPD